MGDWYGVAALFAFFVVCALWPTARRWWQNRRRRAEPVSVRRQVEPDGGDLWESYRDQKLRELGLLDDRRWQR